MPSGFSEINIGGVTYREKDVKSSSVEKKQKTDNKGVFQQYEEYTVKLKNGVVIKYQEQNPDRQARVTDDGKGLFDTDQITTFDGLEGARISDNNNKNDIFWLNGCEYTKVETMSGNKSNDEDLINFHDREMPDGSVQKSKSNWAYKDPQDAIGDEHHRREYYSDNGRKQSIFIK